MSQNRVSGLVVTLVGAALLLWIIPSQTEMVDSGWVKPSTLPNVMAVIIVIGGLAQLFSPGGEAGFDPAFSLRMGLFFAVTLAGVYLMKRVGFVIAGPALTAVIMILIREKRPVWLVSGVLLLPVSIWFCVEYLLKKPLP